MADSSDHDLVQAFMRITSDMLRGVTGFAFGLAAEGRISPDEIDDLAHRLTPSCSEEDSPAHRELCAIFEQRIAETISSVHRTARESTRDRPSN